MSARHVHFVARPAARAPRTDPMSDDHRQEPRVPIGLRVDYRKMNTFFADYTKNISKGGIFIKTPSPLPVGTRFMFELAIPAFPEPVQLDGEVTWALDEALAAATSQDAGMGIRFVFDEHGRRAAFEAAVEKLMLDSLGPEIYRQLLGKAG
jgi:type IV pilus assembly protein PilZ